MARAETREFTEDHAFLRAVVSLPQETFVSAGASVKCSLLFLQKFTVDEQLQFDEIYATARAEIESRYADEIKTAQERIKSEIEAAKKVKNTERCKSLQKTLNDYLKAMQFRQISESRQLLKNRFDYPIFMYEAEKVGISATGEEDQNELYPNDNQPANCEKTCLELFREFVADPKVFAEVRGA